ncbi:hypothetical protein EGW08_003887 [Elysia chlorotica]|uniref:SMB domain-containing protein n=1 Tax=Elysia chlorotica TaxID=188477 RepID=A0A433U3I2_ELYCH|nr:hypothetical protein EGW08_003887 [Elysia chlorotica]
MKTGALLICLTFLQSSMISCQEPDFELVSSMAEHQTIFQQYPIISSTVRDACLQNNSRCQARCGKVADITIAEMFKPDWSACSCDALCLVYGDCCWDFLEACPDQVLDYRKNPQREAQASCHHGYSLLEHRPTRLSMQSNLDLVEFEDFPGDSPGPTSMSEIFDYLKSGRTAVTDTQMGRHYRSLKDFYLLNRYANMSQRQGLVSWDMMLTYDAEVAFSMAEMLSYVRDQVPLPDDLIMLSSSPPATLTVKPRLCPLNIKVGCYGLDLGFLFENVSHTCEILMGGNMGNPNFGNGRSTSREESRSGVFMDRSRVGSNRETVEPLEPPVTLEPEETPLAEAANIHIVCSSSFESVYDQYRSQIAFSYLMSVGVGDILQISNKQPSQWSGVTCDFSPRALQSSSSSSSSSVNTEEMYTDCRVVCSAGNILFQDACSSPIFMLVRATAAQGVSSTDFMMALQDIFSVSKFLNSNALVLEEDPSTCTADAGGWFPGDEVGFYGTYHIKSRSFMVQELNQLPVMKTLRDTLKFSNADGRSPQTRIESLTVWFIFDDQFDPRSFDISFEEQNHDMMRVKTCEQKPWIWSHDGTVSDPLAERLTVFPSEPEPRPSSNNNENKNIGTKICYDEGVACGRNKSPSLPLPVFSLVTVAAFSVVVCVIGIPRKY